MTMMVKQSFWSLDEKKGVVWEAESADWYLGCGWNVVILR